MIPAYNHPSDATSVPTKPRRWAWGVEQPHASDVYPKAPAAPDGVILPAVRTGRYNNLIAVEIANTPAGRRWYKERKATLPRTFAFRGAWGGISLFFQWRPDAWSGDIIRHSVTLKAEGETTALFFVLPANPLLSKAPSAPCPDWLVKALAFPRAE